MWLRKAYNININEPNKYFTALDPGEFYEWQYKQYIPEGTIFTKKLPSSDIFTTGLIIASAHISNENLVKTDRGYKTKTRIASNINLEVGKVQSPQELLSRFKDLQSKFSQCIDKIKQSCKNNDFVISQENKVLRILDSYDETVKIASYGDLDEFVSILQNKKVAIEKDALTKKGRAYEMSDYIKFRDTITLLKSTGFNTDSMRISFLVNTAKIEPKDDFTLSWKDYCVSYSKEGSDYMNLIDNYMTFSWVRDALAYS